MYGNLMKKPAIAAALVIAALFCAGCRSAAPFAEASSADSDTGVEVFPQLGHGQVVAVAYSPDGRRMAYLYRNGPIKIFDVESGRELRTISTSGVQTGTISYDGRYIISKESPGYLTIIKIWDAENGHQLQSETNLLLSPDGRRTVSWWYNGYESAIRLWDMVNQRELRVFRYAKERDIIKSVAISPDGQWIVFGSANKTIKMVDTETGKKLRTLSGHSGAVNSVAFSPDGRRIVSGSADNTIKIWDAESRRELSSFSGLSVGETVEYNPNGRLILYSSEIRSWDYKYKVLDAESGRELWTLDSNTFIHSADGLRIAVRNGTDIIIRDAESGRELLTISNPGELLAYNSDKRQIVSSFSHNTIYKIWDSESGQELHSLSINHDAVKQIAYSPNGRQLAINDRILDTESWQEQTFAGAAGVGSMAISPDGRQLAIPSGNIIKIWSFESWQELQAFPGYGPVVYSPDGRRLVCKSLDRTIKVWDVESGQELRTFSAQSSGGLKSLAYSPDGRKIAGGYSGTGKGNESFVSIWDVESGQELRTISGFSNWQTAMTIAFSPDGRQIVSGTSGIHNLKIWDAESGQELRNLSLPRNLSVYSVAYSPDGRQMAAGGGSGSGDIVIYDAKNGQKLQTISNEGLVWSMAYSPDGRNIVSCSVGSNTLKISDVESGQQQILYGHGQSYGVHYVAYSPDGQRIVSASYDHTARIWDASTGEELAQYVSFTDGEWVWLTPDGYYKASLNGDRHLNVRVGNNVYGIDQYRATFDRPAVVEARLSGSAGTRIAGTAMSIQDAASFSPPAVIILSPVSGGSTTTAGTVDLSVVIMDASQPIKNIKVLVNGRRVGSDELGRFSGSRGIVVESASLNVTGNEKQVEFRFPVNLEPGENRIEVLAFNGYSEGRALAEVNLRTSQRAPLPNLWILSVGVNRYDDKIIKNLEYAVNDATEIINVFKAQEGKLYGKVNSLLIADGASIAPTRDAIMDNLSYLRKAGQQDVVALFIAGHGMNDDGGNFFFLPSDAAFDADGSIRPSKAISHRDLYGVLEIPGQKLVFIDSCHSEGVTGRQAVDGTQLARSLRVDGSTVIFTSSQGTEYSQESRDYRHGIFTYSIITGMKGAADLIKDSRVSMMELAAYVMETVPTLTGEAQHPVADAPNGFRNFTVSDLK
ncbi:caspase family protein [Treponema primitia]|uniref:WD40 domain-containing protein n=1 Tax=Treponema primitia TaxID=88058 RepID=UPI0039815C67